MSDGVRWLLLRLHPRPWRSRFGEEFSALLEETPLRVSLVADVLRHALRLQAARALRGAGRTRLHRALLAVAVATTVGGVLLAATVLPGPHLTQQQRSQILRQEFARNQRQAQPW